jgi:hypothetical protein
MANQSTKKPAPKKKAKRDEPLTLEKHLTDDLKAGTAKPPYNPTRPKGPRPAADH